MHVGDFRISREVTFGAHRQQVDRNNGTTNGSNEQSLWRPHYEPLYKLDGLIALSGGYRLLESLRGVYIVAQNAEWKSHFGNTGGAGTAPSRRGRSPSRPVCW